MCVRACATILYKMLCTSGVHVKAYFHCDGHAHCLPHSPSCALDCCECAERCLQSVLMPAANAFVLARFACNITVMMAIAIDQTKTPMFHLSRLAQKAVHTPCLCRSKLLSTRASLRSHKNTRHGRNETHPTPTPTPNTHTSVANSGHLPPLTPPSRC